MRDFTHRDMPIKLRDSLAAILIGMAILATRTADAATVIWTNTAGGAWETTTSWNLGVLPGSSDTAQVGSNGNYTVTIGSSAANTVPNFFTNANLQVNGLPSGSPTLELTFTNATTFVVTSDLEVGNGTLTLNASNGLLSATGGSLGFNINQSLGKTGIVNVSAGTLAVGAFRIAQEIGRAHV